MIELRQITKQFGQGASAVRALDSISLHVPEGCIYGVVGSSGAGKSTLIRCVNLLERPTSGQVIVAGKDLTAMAESDLRRERRHIGMIFQHFNLLSSRTVFGNIALPLELAGMSSAEIEKMVLPLLELTGLTDKRNSYPSQLSGGQKQRVAIARALINQPSVILADEPTGNLDTKTGIEIMELFRRLNQERKITIIFVTHDPEIADYCNRKIHIRDGLVEVDEYVVHRQDVVEL